MKNGKKIKRVKSQVQYRLQLGFKLTSLDNSAASFGGDFEFPIGKEFKDKLNKLKKRDVVQLLTQLAEAIDKEDYSLLGLPVDMRDMRAVAKVAGSKAN